ncbi:sialate O-acetylesterase [Dyella telluris]|uniref:Beta galactosidase jelly roll domain-containing protein n=1 Tax=Dyella telluris TaxID=2763498 RepID=A0A7G8QAZ2_9GAMM|nr:sialate O-acetylesterase [Dyella telluris]QNK03950.1 beta galactosidase jelly roll domain-containing protein [Dyella telluris]
MSLPVAAQAKLELPLMFSQGAVLQRDMPMHVWGWSAPGAKVTVGFDGAHAIAKADAKGRWDATLPRHAAGGPFAMDIDDGSEHRVLRDMLVGDVWLCSGQSNMEFTMAEVRDAAAEQARANDPAIRHFKIPHSWSLQPQDRLEGGSWVAASPSTVSNFSAVCWFFARDMKARTGVPQGLINSSWGGSSVEAWTDARTGKVDVPALAARIKKADDVEEAKLDQTRQRISRWPSMQGDVVDAAGKPAWAAEKLDTSDWADIPVPAYWETVGYYDMDGVAWYRTAFTLSATEAAQGVTLSLGAVDDSDRSYVNGRLVGETVKQWNAPRVYKVPASALHAGSNSIAVRVDDLGNGGGMHGDAAALYVQTAKGERRPLAGTWRFHTANVTLVPTPTRHLTPTLLYNGMIQPLLGYPLRGVVWYQGESNAWAPDSMAYRQKFGDMIQAWRTAWNQPELPFIWVQLANYKSGSDTPAQSPWAELRESQSAVLSLPHTGQAVIIDVGNPDDIHPTNKQDVGHRLALAARHVVFGDAIVYSGPVYREWRADGAKAVVSFDPEGAPLAVRGGGNAVGGFEVAGADGHFQHAQARIEGGSVVVSSKEVAHPASVRYGWSDNPVDANLTNGDGLPASPFRTAPSP